MEHIVGRGVWKPTLICIYKTDAVVCVANKPLGLPTLDVPYEAAGAQSYCLSPPSPLPKLPVRASDSPRPGRALASEIAGTSHSHPRELKLLGQTPVPETI